MASTTRNDSLVESISRFLALVYNIVLVYSNCIAKLFKPTKRKSIRGQNVLITGSGHGLGRELAIKFAQNGANLALVDVNQENNEKVRNQLLKAYKTCKIAAYSIDIRDEARVAQLAVEVKRDLGSIDILVNNAGIVQCLPFNELSPAMIERTFQVNVLAHFWTIKHFLPDMIEKRRGHIVAIASLAGLIGAKYLTDYCASKFAVVGLMEALERELHDQGLGRAVRLTTVCPSSISTGMFKSLTSRFNWLLPISSAEQIAEGALDGALRNKSIVVLPQISLIFYNMANFIPRRVACLIQEYLDYGVKPHSK